jgi:hypothetical protein
MKDSFLVKLGIFRWGVYPGISGWAQCSHRNLIRWRQEGQSEKGMVQWNQGLKLGNAGSQRMQVVFTNWKR